MDISPKVNMIARLEFELCYFVAKIEHFSHDILKKIFYTIVVFDFRQLWLGNLS